MAFSHLLHLNPHRIRVVKHLFPNTSLLYCSFSTVSSDLPPPPPQTPKPTSLSARMSFIFDQIDQIENSQRNANEEKDKTLQRIRAWRQSKNQNPIAPVTPIQSDSDSLENLNLELEKSAEDVRISRVVEKDKEVVLVHPWAEWIEFMERLVQQNYFDYRRKDEDGMMERLGVEIAEDGSGGGGGGVKDLMRDFKAVQNAVLNFGRDRFDILRFLSRQDLQLLVGYGCPTTDKRTVFSAKLLRKHVHLDEGDVCSSCSLRNSCEKAYLLTNKEDEARTIDVMRILLTYGFEPIYGSVENKSLLQMKSVKTVIRKLLHEVVKLSAVPIDPNLSPPVIKKPPPKVKQPPPPPRKKIGRNDIEMKKGDWLCPKCDFMNFAKNTVCLHCDAKRPKRQLLPGEWECPQCNFLNYRRNTVCFHCEHNRPPETYAENQFTEKQYGPGFRTSKIPDRASVSNAWNFDFDDNESDGADVAAFENADSLKLDEDYSHDRRSYENSRRHQNSMEMRGTHQRLSEHSDPSHKRPGVGFNDFDEEDEDDVDNYELVNPNEESKISRVDLSELESDSGSEDRERNRSAQSRTRFSAHGKKQQQRRAPFTGSEDEIDFNSDDDLPIHPKYKSTHVAANMKKHNNGSREGRIPYSDDEDDIGLSSDIDDEIPKSTKKGNFRSGYDGSSRTKGARSSFKAAPFSDMDSDNGRSYNNGNKQRDRSGRHSLRDESREWSSKRSSFDRRSGSRRNNTDNYENSYRGKTNNGKGGKFSKFAKPDRQHASFDKRGGRSSNFDNGSSSNFLDDERHRRPRNNVR